MSSDADHPFGGVGIAVLRTITRPLAVSTPALATADTSVVDNVAPAVHWTVRVKCQKVKYGGAAVGYVYGQGSGRTHKAARSAALKDADRHIPVGY